MSYNSNVTLGTIYSDLGLSQPDKNAEVYYNGVQASDVAVTRNNAQKISSATANNKLVGDGTIVDVYYDSEPNDVTICVVDVYVGEIASVNTTAADPYVVVVPASTMTAKNLSTFTLSGNERRFETTDSFDEETVVLFTYSQSANEIKSVVAAEYVEGTVAEYVSGDNLTVGETKYDYAKNIAFSFGAESDMQTKGDYVVYVDQNGYAIYVDEPEFNPTDYAYVLNAETAGSAAFGRDQAKLVTAQGKLMTVDTDDNYTDLIGKIVTYREDESGDYALRAAPNSYQNAASFTRNFDSDGKTNDASGILKGASWGFDLKNSNASITVGAGSWEDGVQIQIDSDNDGAKDDPLTTVYANSETVFVVARTDSSAPYNTTYTAYVGVRNVPNIDGTRANVEATYYVRGNNIVAFMFIDAGRATVTGGSNDVVFLAGAEGMKGHVYSNDGSDYYLYNAVVSGKVTQVKVDANLTVGSFDGGDETNFLIQSPVTNNKGIITSATAASSISATGIWKLSGEYTIGLGGNRASESVRYTVASNADMFYVDTDGVITKIAEVSDIVSDTDAKVLAVMGADGDIEHLFIQEVDSNSSENAPGGSDLNITSVAYNTPSTGDLKVDFTAATVATTLTVTVQEYTNGQWTTMNTYSQSVAVGETTKTFAIGSMGMMYAHHVLVNGQVYSI